MGPTNRTPITSIRSFGILLLTLGVLPYSTFGAVPKYRPIERSCGVSEPSAELYESHRRLQHNEPLDNDLWNATSVQQRHAGGGAFPHGDDGHHHHHQGRQASSGKSPLYTIDTYIHIVADTSSSVSSSPNYVSDTMISNQFRYLSAAYVNASIGFRLMGITRTTNDTWASNGDDGAMKRSLRQGTYSSLNIYYQSLLQAGPNTPGIPAGSTLLGFCSLPAAGVGTATPRELYVADGCNVLSGTMPGGNVAGYNLGGTTAHEVGHWNGLLHTFNGNSCDSADYGDYVADTPQEMTSTNRCPVYKDSCPLSGVPPGSYTGGGGGGATAQTNPYGPQGYSGPDPIHNFMDYSSDECYQGFTPGQGARMLNIWQIYREGL
ncbi:Extracellular metalloprotease [Exophiala dermatitidis]|uniref:Pappalysin-1 n=1 Tax=Exophiala dermatitidis (strain ATCC 34100 / CBS 525.76 / NIH/UT8656) TaxID=858893 RepID=H6BWG6_EXODN|nr:pappalysin-1 [Exophiala dermatitidis NIH/UT8656]EHY55212.1 pappalysin-1 [Exophiala dermatitidis NIH/UT8656]